MSKSSKKEKFKSNSVLYNENSEYNMIDIVSKQVNCKYNLVIIILKFFNFIIFFLIYNLGNYLIIY